MPKTHFTRSGGYAWVNSIYNELRTTGNVFYVCSINGTDAAGYGFSPDSPFASISYAVLQCVADNGDTVIVMPMHIEIMATAGKVTMSLPGVTVRGIGKNGQRPKVNFTANVASWLITTPRCVVSNLWFTITGTLSVGAYVAVEAADTTVEDCHFDMSTLIGVVTNGVKGLTSPADRLHLARNRFADNPANGTGMVPVYLLAGGQDVVIENNIIAGHWDPNDGAIQVGTTDCYDLLIAGNVVLNRVASSTKAIVLSSGTTGAVVNNRIGILSGGAPITGAALDHVGGNYYTNAVGVEAGTLI